MEPTTSIQGEHWDTGAVHRDRTVALVGELIIWAGAVVLVAAATLQVAKDQSEQIQEQRAWMSQAGLALSLAR